MEIGRRLRDIRTQRGLVIDDIAAASGLSRAYISQVETGKASPSLQALSKLAGALDVAVASLFVSDGAEVQLIRAADRQVLQYGDPDKPGGIRKMIQFMSAPNRAVEMVQLEIPVGYAAGDENHIHEGEEVFSLIAGRVKAVHGSRTFVLEVGDSLHLSATVPHYIRNIGDIPAVLLVARTPPGFADLRFDEKADDTVMQ